MAKWIAAFLAVILCFQGFAFAQDKESVNDRIIGAAFKALAKTFVLTADMDKLKRDNIVKIRNMDEAKFKKRYTRVYAAIKGLPEKVKITYGISDVMDKKQAVRNIESLDKKKACEIIDAVPDALIAKEFLRYISNKKGQTRQTNVTEQVSIFWKRTTEKLNISSPVPK